MAQVLGTRKRGRKREALRVAVEALASKLAPAGKDVDVTVEVAPAKSARGKAETVTFAVPKGSVVVDPALTRGKTDANARTQIASGVRDAEVGEVSIQSVAVLTDDGDEFPIFYVTLK